MAKKKSKFKVGERVWFTWAGPRFKQEGSVEHVRKDGLLIVHFDADPPGTILVVQPYEVDPISTKTATKTHHATKKSSTQLQREIDEALSKRTSTEPQLATWRSSSDIQAATKKGDRLDNFGQIWRVIRVARNKITAARELADFRDPEKVVLVDQRDFHPRDIAHMRQIG